MIPVIHSNQELEIRSLALDTANHIPKKYFFLSALDSHRTRLTRSPRKLIKSHHSNEDEMAA